MSKKEDSVLPSDSSSTQSDTTQKGSVADMMLGKSSEKVIDSDTMIQETQQRIWSSLK
ncbi:MAG: adenylate/guanylate cyclase domain-containing protein, partial [Candidatus Nitrosopelagicus sp.]|nr:adenylate/guanylate cyclase domain-containing protein [Candidatus Nitrosopelagicus sp.]